MFVSLQMPTPKPRPLSPKTPKSPFISVVLPPLSFQLSGLDLTPLCVNPIHCSEQRLEDSKSQMTSNFYETRVIQRNGQLRRTLRLFRKKTCKWTAEWNLYRQLDQRQCHTTDDEMFGWKNASRSSQHLVFSVFDIHRSDLQQRTLKSYFNGKGYWYQTCVVKTRKDSRFEVTNKCSHYLR